MGDQPRVEGRWRSKGVAAKKASRGGRDTEPHALMQAVSHAGQAGGHPEQGAHLHSRPQETPRWPPLTAQKAPGLGCSWQSTRLPVSWARAEAPWLAQGRTPRPGPARDFPTRRHAEKQAWCVWGKKRTESRAQDMKMEPLLTPYTKPNSKWIKGPNARAETVKLSENSAGERL